MGVTLQNVMTWRLPIPYVAESQLEQVVLDNFNQAIGHRFFVPHNGSADVTVLRFDSASPGRCHIGFTEGENERIVAYRPGSNYEQNYQNKVRTLLHELGHCIGLAHEQCHGDYAWDYGERFANSLASPELALNKTIFAELSGLDPKDKRRAKGGIFSFKMVDVALERQNLKYIDLTPYCDYESIMMYDIYHTAAVAAAKEEFRSVGVLTPKLQRIPTSLPPSLPPRDGLTGNDVISIRLLYRL